MKTYTDFCRRLFDLLDESITSGLYDPRDIFYIIQVETKHNACPSMYDLVLDTDAYYQYSETWEMFRSLRALDWSDDAMVKRGQKIWLLRLEPGCYEEWELVDLKQPLPKGSSTIMFGDKGCYLGASRCVTHGNAFPCAKCEREELEDYSECAHGTRGDEYCCLCEEGQAMEVE